MTSAPMTSTAMTAALLARLSEPTELTGPSLTIREVARQSGLSEHTLRYYERVGLLMPIPRHFSSKHRRYPPQAVSLAETLAFLRKAGMSLDSIRRYLRLREQGVEGAARQKALFAAHKDVLEREVAAMQRRIEYVAGKVAFWEAVEAGDAARAQAIADANCLLANALIHPAEYAGRGLEAQEPKKQEQKEPEEQEQQEHEKPEHETQE